MKRLAVKNLLGRPGRTAALFFLVLLLSLTLCGGGLVLSSLRTGLGSLENRLGADVIVMPAKAALKTDLDTLFLQGTIGPYYMSMSTVDKIAKTEGIDRLSTQIFLSSMRASCCSIPIQVIGFDPESDFTVSSWLKESRQESLDDGRLLVGSRVNANPGESIKLYNISCPVAGQLQSTGTGLDTAVYCTLPTIRTLMTAAEDLGGYSSISGDPSETVSAVYIKVKEGVDPKDVADSINVHVRKVKAVQTRSVITTVADSLSGLEGILTLLIIAAAVLVWLVLFAAFTLMTGERKKEFATLRLCGLSRGRLAGWPAWSSGKPRSSACSAPPQASVSASFWFMPFPAPWEMHWVSRSSCLPPVLLPPWLWPRSSAVCWPVRWLLPSLPASSAEQTPA